MSTKKAVFVKDVSKNFNGEAALYRLSPPMEIRDWDENVTGTTDYVVVSAAMVPYTGPETYIFPANENGEVVSWGELDGSFRGELNIPAALRNAGYSID